MTILFIRGINDSNTASITPGENGSVGIAYDGCCGIYWAMNFASRPVEEVTLFGNRADQKQVRLKSPPTLVINEISDPDSHYGALKRCEMLCQQLQCPVINHPSKILQTTRDNISRLLQDIPGLRMPLTVRLQPGSPEDIFTEIEKAGLEFPVIVRLAGSHGGKDIILLPGHDDLGKLHVYPFDGSIFYLTEFIDYASDDGLYRKYRIVVIDGVPMFRHLLIDRKWMVHASSLQFMKDNNLLTDTPTTLHRVFDAQTLPMLRPAIDEITRRLQLEYYGIDCSIDGEGNILIFEVNANMNILLNDYLPLEGKMNRIKQDILNMLDKYAASGSRQKERLEG